MIGVWLSGLVRRRAARLAGAASGVAVAVALLAVLGAFLATSQASMTARAVRDVSVDWQVEVQPGADPAAVLATVRATGGTHIALPVGFARTSGMSADALTTGPGVALGLPPGYRAAFPGELRTLAGADDGVLLAQQTAANLHAVPGSMILLGRAGLAPVPVRVDGVVDLPQANSLFQTVGAAPGAQPAAPPDNVVLLPQSQWHALFDPLGPAHPELVGTQIHVARGHDLPADPASAFTSVTAAAHNLEAHAAGTARVGDKLGAALDAARSDAAYARLLFLLLGLPGAVLAGLLTGAVTAAGATRRRREQALARLRGATAPQLIRLAAVEAGLVGALGAVAGLVAAAVIARVAFGSGTFPALWTGGAALAGLVIAFVTVLGPAWRDLRGATVAAAVSTVDAGRAPRWARYGVDLLLLAGGGLLVWAAGGNGYQLVLAPEGVPTISVSYWAFAGPALLWAGAGLLAWRLAELGLGRGRRLITRALRPLAGVLAPTAAAILARRRRPLARSAMLVGLALAFAVSTATFNTTYQAQAEVDAQLTNGADVTVTESPGTAVGPDAATQLSGVPGVRAVEPVQHRFAYIGADLQDLYGVRPDRITDVTALRDSYFQGGTARALMNTLAAKPDSILVSAETVKDYQLATGDLINLRLRDSHNQLITVPFHYAGIVSEFPTAPKDSFFVANASYLAARTGSGAVGALLVDTGGQNVTGVADRIRALLGPTATVTDIAHTRSVVGSSLTAVDLSGLTRVELGFALVLAAAAGGLVLALGLAERRRGFAIASALGATRGQLRGLVAAEAAVLSVGGLLAGALAGWLLSEVLVAVLTGVFDPPPTALTVPWGYLASAGLVAIVALVVAVAVLVRQLRRGDPVIVLREP